MPGQPEPRRVITFINRCLDGQHNSVHALILPVLLRQGYQTDGIDHSLCDGVSFRQRGSQTHESHEHYPICLPREVDEGGES